MTVDTLVLWLGTTMKFTTHLPFHLFSRALIEKIRFECWETWRQGTPGVGFHSRAPPRGRGGGSRDPGCHRPCCRSPPTRLHQCSLIRADNQQMSSSQTFQIVVDLWGFRKQFTSENVNVTIDNTRYVLARHVSNNKEISVENVENTILDILRNLSVYILSSI